MNWSTVVGGDRSSRVAYRVVFLLLLALALFPVLANRRLPLNDYPNHLARAYVLHHLDDVPAFSRMYRSEWRLYPNLAIDAVVVPLQALFTLGSAAKIFEILLVLGSFLGAHFLGREIHGRPTFLAPVTIYFLFSLFMLYGFVNYLFGLGVFYIAFAVWLRALRTDDRRWLVVSLLLVFACYLSHLSAYVFFSIAAMVWAALHYHRGQRLRTAFHLMVILPPLIIYVLAAVPVPPAARVWDGPFGKLKGLAYLVIGYNWRIDFFLFGLLAFGLILALGHRRKLWFVDRAVLLISVAFFVAFLLSPSESNGTWALDRRFLVPAAVLGLLSLRVDGPAPRILIGYGMILAATVAHLVLLAAEWSRLAEQVTTYVDLIDQTVPRQSSLAALTFLDSSDKSKWPRQMPFNHAHLWSVIDCDIGARGLFAFQGQQPLRVLPTSRPIISWPAKTVPPKEIGWPAIFHEYDSLVTYQLTEPYREFLNSHCQIAGVRLRAVVYRNCVLNRPAN